MISSTIVDLPEHRQEVINACLRQGMFPLAMENQPASYDNPLAFSKNLVNRADIFVGIYANRYGFVPKKHQTSKERTEVPEEKQISLIEIEYAQAVERKIPRLIFIMDKEHPVKAQDVEIGLAASKIEAFKNRVKIENIVNFFKSPADLRAHVINGLSHLRKPDLASLHYVNEIVAPPTPYVAHPYVLLQSKDLIGRDSELKFLCDWVAKLDDQTHEARILCIVALGGMGKSALTWKWFRDIVPRKTRRLAGQIWWSFYESDASFENFVLRALAYVSQEPKDRIENMLPSQREQELLSILDQKPFLLVLDGLERVLMAYARMDAAQLSEDDFDDKTVNRVCGAFGTSSTSTEPFTGKHILRKAADPRVGSLLRRLTAVKSSRVLISTRLFPSDLQASSGEAIPGSIAYFLGGLKNDDALKLWREFGVSGTRQELIRLFRTFENHPLLIQALAAEVANYRRHPGDLKKWLEAHPSFNPFSLPLIQVRSHVLEAALQGLSDYSAMLLQRIAAFRMPASYDTLAALTVDNNKKLFSNEIELDLALTELEDRGLLGWDKRANRYDLHPIVRGVAWSSISREDKQDIYSDLQNHFGLISYRKDWHQISSLDELTAPIELYNTLVALGRNDDAFNIFHDRCWDALLYGLGSSRQIVDLLEMLCQKTGEFLPNLRNPLSQSTATSALALGYKLIGEPTRAITLYHRVVAASQERKDSDNLCNDLDNLSSALYLVGRLYEAEAASRRTYQIGVESRSETSRMLGLLGIFLLSAIRQDLSMNKSADSALWLSLQAETNGPYEWLALGGLFLRDYAGARNWSEKAIARCEQIHHGRGLTRALRIRGAALLALGHEADAEVDLHQALARATEVQLVEEELPALISLAQLRCRQGDFRAAREYLDEVWDAVEETPYPLFHADALNTLADIEIRSGAKDAAAEAAMRAYCRAWCDGLPFAYQNGLQTAKNHLTALTAAVPADLPLFDQSKFEPLPRLEIGPDRI